jgi:hypothetical protein
VGDGDQGAILVGRAGGAVAVLLDYQGVLVGLPL